MSTKVAKSIATVETPKLTKIQRVAKIIELREQGKAAYAEAEALEAGLLDRMSVGEQTKLPNGKTAQLIDNFADKNVKWCHSSCRRFELKVV